MKKGLFFAFALSMGMMVGCGDSSSDSGFNASENNGGNSTDNNGGGNADTSAVADTLTPFFPEGYKAEDVVAWFATEASTDVEKDRTKIFVDAVFLFKDGSFVATENKVKIRPDEVTYSKDVVGKGTWTGSKDDFENGAFEIKMGENSMSFEIKDGVFSIAPEGGESLTYTLMTTDVPKASKAGETKEQIKDEPKDEPKDDPKADPKDNPKDDPKGPGEAADVTAFFPKGYDASKVVAWYTTGATEINEKGQTKKLVDAVYLFDDGSFIVTEQKVKTKDKISTFENAIVAEGSWEGSKDKTENGSLTISLDEMDIPLEIKDGKFSINPFGGEEMNFTLSKSDVPEASEVTVQEGNHDRENPDGTEEQQEWAKALITRAETLKSSIATFEISDPVWERIQQQSEAYMATYTVTVTLSEGEFVTEGLEYPTLSIGQYPVHAIESKDDALPVERNNNDWEVLEGKVEGKKMTVKIQEKIDNLKLGRAYVYVKMDGMTSAQFSEAFFIVPPCSEDALK